MDDRSTEPATDADEVKIEPHRLDRGNRVMAVLEQVWPLLPSAIRGSYVTREQEDEILGDGPDGI